MSAQLAFEVNDQIITRIDNFQPVSKSQNYLRASFIFNGDWGNKEKIALFQSGNKSYAVSLDKNNECDVPWEALSISGNVYVSVFSGNRITSTRVPVRVLPSGYTEVISATQDPTIDVYQSIIQRLNDMDNKASKLLLDASTTFSLEFTSPCQLVILSISKDQALNGIAFILVDDDGNVTSNKINADSLNIYSDTAFAVQIENTSMDELVYLIRIDF